MLKRFFSLYLLLFSATGFAQLSEGQKLLNDISATPEYPAPQCQVYFRQSSPTRISREEIVSGKIRMSTEIFEMNLNGKKDKESVITAYDKKGNVLSQEKRDSTGKMTMKLTYVYAVNPSGKIGQVRVTRMPENELYEFIMSYDSTGHITERHFTVKNSAKENGSVPAGIQERPQLPDPNGDYTETYSYNSAGQLLQYLLDVKNNYRRKVSFGYDDQHRLIYKTTRTDPPPGSNDSALYRFFREEYSYETGTGFITKIVETRSDMPDNPGTIEYRYDRTGHITLVRRQYKQKGYGSEENYYFNSEGKKVKSELRSGDGTLISSNVIVYENPANGISAETEESFTSTGYTKTITKRNDKKLLVSENGSYTGTPGSSAARYFNTFQRKISYEYYP